MRSPEIFARSKRRRRLPVQVSSYQSHLIKKGKGVDPVLQQNKAVNIKIAGRKINGIIIRPGETFSFWRTVGSITKKKGYKDGRIISANKLQPGLGGGLCNLGNTIHLLVIHSPLQVTEFHTHSDALAPDEGKRVPMSSGTSVCYNYIDFRFKNTSADNVYICCNLSDDKRVRFGIFGLMLENGETITIEAATTRTLDYKTEYKPTPLLPPGQSYLMQTGRVGYEAEAYKLRWDAEGNQIGRELLCKSRYPARNEVIQYGVEPDAE